MKVENLIVTLSTTAVDREGAREHRVRTPEETQVNLYRGEQCNEGQRCWRGEGRGGGDVQVGGEGRGGGNVQ